MLLHQKLIDTHDKCLAILNLCLCPHEPYVILFLSHLCYSGEWGLQD